MATTINFKRISAMTAAVGMMLVAGGGALAYYTPVSYVSMDVNPSIEYKLNMFERVLSVKGINDDGTEVLEEIVLSNLGNKTIEEALALTVQHIAEKGYLDSGDGGIVIATNAKDLKKAEAMAQRLQETAQGVVDSNEKFAEVSAEAVGAARVAEAQQLGVTPGKLNLVERMMATSLVSGTLNREEWLSRSVKDIMAMTNQFRAEVRTAEKNSGEEKQNNKPDGLPNGKPDSIPGGKPASTPGGKLDSIPGNKPDDVGKGAAGQTIADNSGNNNSGSSTAAAAQAIAGQAAANRGK